MFEIRAVSGARCETTSEGNIDIANGVYLEYRSRSVESEMKGAGNHGSVLSARLVEPSHIRKPAQLMTFPRMAFLAL